SGRSCSAAGKPRRDGWKRRRQTSGRSPQPALLVLLLKKRMAFRYRNSIRLGKGLRINLSKSGASLSFGRPGATVNLSERGIRSTVGLPGTGISYSETTPWRRSPISRRFRNASLVIALAAVGLALLVALIR